MNGQKVVKVFTHEPQMERDFDKVNEELFQASKAANIYGNTLGPILFNIGNLAYVLVALAGSVFMSLSVPNLSIRGLALTIDIVVPYLNLTKRFAGSIGQVSQQINFVVMGLAGAERIFGLMGEEPESDEGYVPTPPRRDMRRRPPRSTPPSSSAASPTPRSRVTYA